jgi:TonB family protein
VNHSFAQADYMDTTWFESHWKESSKAVADYYRVYKKTDKGFIVYDKFINNNIQMIAEVSEIKPELIQNGYSIYYNANGSISSHGYSKYDKRTGDWVIYDDNGKDSSISEYKDGLVIATKGLSIPSERRYVLTDIMPEFQGGAREMRIFLESKIIYPKEARKKEWQGKAFIKFIIDERGNVVNPKVIKSSGHEILDDEALRVVKLMPRWKPGKQDHKVVPVEINLPISFYLAN